MSWQAPERQQAGYRSHPDASQDSKAQLPDGRAPQGERAVQWGHVHVTNLGRLNDQRPSPPSGTQTNGPGQAYERTDHLGPVLADSSHVGEPSPLVTDEARQYPHGHRTHDGGHIDPVKGFEDVEVLDSAGSAALTKLSQNSTLFRGGQDHSRG
jgi:hypothetical protein